MPTSKGYTSRYFHVSCFAAMVPHPLGPTFPVIPYVEKPGVTYRRGDKPRLRFDQRNSRAARS